jgi:hypothetical protein
MSDWRERLTRDLEPKLRSPDPRPLISAYHDMPYAIFRYPPEEEFAVRSEVRLLQTRLEQGGKRITIVSLAECLTTALHAEGMGPEALAQAEVSVGLDKTIETVFEIISSCQPLDKLVVEQIPTSSDPLRDVAFIVRAGALFPMYRTSSLLEQLKGKVEMPSVLFYPGLLEGAAGLRFMGVLDAEHNYRPRIF